MKRLVKPLLLILFYLTTVPFWQRFFLAKPLVRVWCLHEVKDSQVLSFKKKLAYLHRRFNIITPGQFKNGELSSRKINLLITFDDGFDSWFKNVLPILNQAGFKAIFFINQAFYQKAAKLTEAGHSLGGHSLSHRRLTELDQAELQMEVAESHRSEFFAYTYGDKKSYSPLVIAEVKKAGFRHAFTILPGYNNAKTDAYLLHRDSLDADVPEIIFRLWLKGCYDWFKKKF